MHSTKPRKSDWNGTLFETPNIPSCHGTLWRIKSLGVMAQVAISHLAGHDRFVPPNGRSVLSWATLQPRLSGRPGRVEPPVGRRREMWPQRNSPVYATSVGVRWRLGRWAVARCELSPSRGCIIEIRLVAGAGQQGAAERHHVHQPARWSI